MGYDEPKGAYWHIEHLALTENGGHVDFLNYVTVTDDSSDLLEKVGDMVAGVAKDAPGDAYAIHIRRIPQPADDTHLYDETQPLARAQADAYRYQRAFEALSQRYRELEASKQKLDESANREAQLLEHRNAAKAAMIERLEMRLDRIRYRVARDLERCVYTESEDLLRIIGGREDEDMVSAAELLREKLLNMLPTEPMGEKFNSDNQYKAALAEWGVYELIAEALGVTLPLAAVEGRLTDDQ